MDSSLLYKLKNYTKSALITLIDSIQHDELLKTKLYLDSEYHNGCGVIDDWRYDIIQSKINSTSIGAPLHDGEIKVKLPYWLGSLNKLKPDNINKIKNYITSDTYLVMDKLDGISCLLVNDASNKLSLYTRGDGIYGKDISYISGYIQGIPSNIQKDIYVRGELVISKVDFKKLGYDVCSRNVVSGAVKSKKVSEVLFNITFVAYELIGVGCIMTQFKMLKEYKFNTVFYQKYSINDNLSLILDNRRKESNYDIDGIVIHDLSNKHHVRNVSGNPKYAFAYKEDLILETTVLDVEWNISKSGFLKPIVKVKPIILCGAMVSATSGYNARFIVDNKIGPNAIISITRSGEVIPKIVDVIKPSDTDIILPEKCEWNSSGVELKTIEKDNTDIKAKELVHFAKVLNIKCIGESTAYKFVENGIDSPIKLLKCKEEDLGLSNVMSSKIYNNIKSAWEEATLEQQMHASGCFDNIGVTTINLILKNTTYYSTNELLNIRGIGTVTAKSFVEGYRKFNTLYKDTAKTMAKDNVGRLKDKIYLYSGFRDYKLSYEGDIISINEIITKNGGTIANGMSKKVSVLIANGSEMTKKIEDAIKYNIKIIYIQDLISSNDILSLL